LTHDALLPKPALLDVTAVAAERAGGDARVPALFSGVCRLRVPNMSW
jgi:hypothetical protein